MSTLTVIVCGSRGWASAGHVHEALDRRWARYEDLTVLEGGAPGADRIAGRWAAARRMRGVGWVRFGAKWDELGKAAGPIRNREMLAWMLADRELRGCFVGVLAFRCLGRSPGTDDMCTTARDAGVPVILRCA